MASGTSNTKGGVIDLSFDATHAHIAKLNLTGQGVVQMANQPHMQGKQPATSGIERLLRHDQVIVAVAVLMLVAVAGLLPLAYTQWFWLWFKATAPNLATTGAELDINGGRCIVHLSLGSIWLAGLFKLALSQEL